MVTVVMATAAAAGDGGLIAAADASETPGPRGTYTSLHFIA